MAEFKRLSVADIFVPPDRVRKVDDNRAFVIGLSVASGELIHPVTVYRTPNGERPYTLAAGATRHRGHELHGLREIDCLVRKLDKAGARRIEVEENLFRADLTMLERAQHVVEYRRLWEEEHGWNKGGRPRTSAKLAGVSQEADLAELGLSGAQAHFFEQALDDFGLSERAIRRAQAIGKSLQPALKAALRGKPEADNQSALERLARLDPDRQSKLASAIELGHDVSAALEHTDPNSRAKATKSDTQKHRDAVTANFHALGRKDRIAVLQDLLARYPAEAKQALAAASPAETGGGRDG